MALERDYSFPAYMTSCSRLLVTTTYLLLTHGSITLGSRDSGNTFLGLQGLLVRLSVWGFLLGFFHRSSKTHFFQLRHTDRLTDG